MPIPCPTCGRTLVCVEIHADDKLVTMRSCTRCDRREWLVDGEPADPTDVFSRR